MKYGSNTSLFQTGFTFIELIIVVSLIAILSASTSPFLSRFVLTINQYSTVDKVVSTIKKAQGYSMSGKDGESWGVCKTGNVVRLYRGTSCSSNSFQEDFDIPASVTVTGMSDTKFSLAKGEPTLAMSVTISSTIATKTVTVTGAGGVSAN